MNLIKKYQNRIPVIAIFSCTLIWATTFAIIKKSLTLIDPFLLSFFRNSIAAFFLLAYIIYSKNNAILKDKKALFHGSILGVLLAAIYIIQAIGLSHTTSNRSALISCSEVIMVPVFLYFIGWQKFTLKQILAIVIITGGLIILTYEPGMSSFNMGDILIFLSAIICAFHLIFAGHYVRNTNFLSLIFYQFLSGAIVSLFSIGFMMLFKDNSQILFQSSSISHILYLSLFGTLFCYFITVWGQKRVSTIYTTLIFSIEPIFASTTSYFVLGEYFSTNEFLGATLILIGLIYYSLPKMIFSKKQKS
jgi:drug/metabolite transporter (DMT)-like permease